MSDVDLLRKVASALDAMHREAEIQLVGLIYMHRITDQRVAGSSLKSIRIFEKICGEENFPCITLVTTMWNLLSKEQDHHKGLERESTLLDKDEFFGRMARGGAKVARDRGEHSTAWAIVGDMVGRKENIVTALQREMAEAGRTLDDTTVGHFLREHINEARRKYEMEREELEEALEEAMRNLDEDLIITFTEESRDLEEKIRRGQKEEQDLGSTRQDLTRLRKEWTEEVLLERIKMEKEEQKASQKLAEFEKIVQNQVEEICSLKRQVTDHGQLLEQRPTQQPNENETVVVKPKKNPVKKFVSRLNLGMQMIPSSTSRRGEPLSKVSYGRSQSLERRPGHVASKHWVPTWNFRTASLPQGTGQTRKSPTWSEASANLPDSAGQAHGAYSWNVETATIPWSSGHVCEAPIRHFPYQVPLHSSSQDRGLVDVGIGTGVKVSGPKRSYTTR